MVRKNIYHLIVIFLESNSNIPSINLQSRQFVNHSYEKLAKVIFETFEELCSEVEVEDEKGHINARVMTIENSHFLFMELKAIKSVTAGVLDPIVRSAKSFYESSLTGYSNLSIHRVLGKYAEYFDRLVDLLKTTAPEEVAFSSAYSKSAVKKQIQAAGGLKEIKKAVNLLRERTLKHFIDQASSLIQVVWKSVQEEFLKRQISIIDALAKIFPGTTEVVLPYSVDDVLAYFSEISIKK